VTAHYGESLPPLAAAVLEMFSVARKAETMFDSVDSLVCEKCPLACWRPKPDISLTAGLPYEPELSFSRFCKRHLFESDPPPIRLTTDQIKQLYEYSSSLPTGTTIGKTWKRRNYALGYPTFWLGEYVELGETKDEVGIIWRLIIENPLETFAGPRRFP
jgi:hypothetical protein